MRSRSSSPAPPPPDASSSSSSSYEPANPSLTQKFNRFIGCLSDHVASYTDPDTRATTSLRFDSSFESGWVEEEDIRGCGTALSHTRIPGNLGKAEAVSPFEYDLSIRADVANPKYVRGAVAVTASL